MGLTIWNSLSPERRANFAVLEHEYEMESVDEGVSAYRRRRGQQDASESIPERELILSSVETLAAAIEKATNNFAEGKAMRGASQWGPGLVGLEPLKLAIITLRQMINAKPGKYNSIDHSYAIAYGVKMERELMVLKNEHRDVFEYIRRRNKNWTPRAHRAAKRHADVVDIEWDKRRRLHVGQKLLELAINNTLLFDVKRWYSGRKKQIKVTLTEEAATWLEKEHAKSEILAPRFLPMVTPPVPWTTQRDGGYVMLREPLIKPSQGVGNIAERDKLHIPEVFNAVNAIQQTEYRINRHILKAQQEAWAAGGMGLVPPEPEALPPVPADIDSNDASKKKWKAEAAAVHDSNARLVSKRQAILHQLRIAEKFSDFPTIYFPHQLDWRGRVYSMCSYLHPQSHDTGRSLLEFAEGRRLGVRGWYWLKVHLANTFGEDKVSNDDRVKWTERHLPKIRRTGVDPMVLRWWLSADKPWQFLAACIDAAAALANPSGPDAHVSHLPVGMDGTCNGLQHLSALGRDQVGAVSTNLRPAVQPTDIYAEVADEVNRLIDEDIRQWNARKEQPTQKSTSADLSGIATGWKGRVTRKTVKRAVMTVPYGLTRQGMMKQLLEDRHTTCTKEAAYLRDKIEAALDGTIHKARQIMAWLQEVASLTADEGHALRWTSPANFPVIQEYLEQSVKTIFTALQKLTYRVTLDTAPVSQARQIRGLPPNLVHSFDAAHLMRVVNRSVSEGIESFQLIHDSYGVHASSLDRFHEIIRQEFVSMYEVKWLEELHHMWEQQTGLTLPPPPELGSLGLNEVLEAKYFFS